jgi:uncharacterized protein (TIGR03067 family)
MNAHRRSWMTVVFALGFAAVLGARAQDANKTEKALQGKWIGEHKGKKMSIQFDQANFTVRFDDDEVNGNFKVDPSKTPKTMDLAVTGGRGQPADRYSGKTSLGIYEVDGDKLKWCACEPGRDERPQQFNPDADGHIYVLFDREKK